jgi:hypothetical protein
VGILRTRAAFQRGTPYKLRTAVAASYVTHVCDKLVVSSGDEKGHLRSWAEANPLQFYGLLFGGLVALVAALVSTYSVGHQAGESVGATQYQARLQEQEKGVDALRERVARLEAHLLPRRVSVNEKKALVTALRAGAGVSITILALGMGEPQNLAGDLEAAFVAAGWKVKSGFELGPGRTSALDLAAASDRVEDATLIADALKTVGIEINPRPHKRSGHLSLAIGSK